LPRLLGFAFGQLEPGFGFASLTLGGASGFARLSGSLIKTPRLLVSASNALFHCFEFHGLDFSFCVCGVCNGLRRNLPKLVRVLQDSK
jgi:hypothetical protein